MQSPYKVLQDWQRYYGGNLLIVLPDAFGTAAFLRDAPDWVADWTGFRPDSAPPIEGGEKIIDWWREEGQGPEEKLLIFSDGLDVDTIEETYRHFRGKVRMAFGWGTNLTNDFEDCAPTATPGLTAISLVCKVTEANGRPAVKLSDNPAKATGDPKEIARYIKLFGEKDRVGTPSRCEAGHASRGCCASPIAPRPAGRRSARSRQSSPGGGVTPLATARHTTPLRPRLRSRLCAAAADRLLRRRRRARRRRELPRARLAAVRPTPPPVCDAAAAGSGSATWRGRSPACSPSSCSARSSPPASSAAAIRCRIRCRSRLDPALGRPDPGARPDRRSLAWLDPWYGPYRLAAAVSGCRQPLAAPA